MASRWSAPVTLSSRRWRNCVAQAVRARRTPVAIAPYWPDDGVNFDLSRSYDLCFSEHVLIENFTSLWLDRPHS